MKLSYEVTKICEISFSGIHLRRHQFTKFSFLCHLQCRLFSLTVVLRRCKCSSFVAFCDNDADTPTCCASSLRNLYGNVSSLAPFSSSISSHGLWLSEMEPFAQTFHLYVTCFPLWNWHIWKFSSQFMIMLLVASIFSTCSTQQCV